MVQYGSYSNATLSNVITYLTDNEINKSRIVNLFYDGSAYVVVFVISTVEFN